MALSLIALLCLLSQTHCSPGLFSNPRGISCLRATAHTLPPPAVLFPQIFTWLPLSSLRALLTCHLFSEALPGHLMYSNDSLPTISSYFLLLMLLFSVFRHVYHTKYILYFIYCLSPYSLHYTCIFFTARIDKTIHKYLIMFL